MLLLRFGAPSRGDTRCALRIWSIWALAVGSVSGHGFSRAKGILFHLGFSRWRLVLDAAVDAMRSSSRQNSCRPPFGNRTPIIGSRGYDWPHRQLYSKYSTTPCFPSTDGSASSSTSRQTRTTVPILNEAPVTSVYTGRALQVRTSCESLSISSPAITTRATVSRLQRRATKWVNLAVADA